MKTMSGMTNMDEVSHHVFHSMGIPVHITLVGVDNTRAQKYFLDVEEIFHAYDNRFSRFKETSELHKLNTANGEWTAVSLPMFQVLKKCVSLAKETNGAFDPSVGGILASYGYGLPHGYTQPVVQPTYRDIEFNERELSVRLAHGQVLEPASIVKGMAIDEGGKALANVPGFLINAGGDIVTRGNYTNGAPWNIAVQDPRNINAIVSAVALRNAGMATSGTYQTKGTHEGREWHHLINMQNKEPSQGFASATVIAHTCEDADTEASLAILLPEALALKRLESRGLPYFLITKDGVTIKNSAFADLEVPVSTLIAQTEK